MAYNYNQASRPQQRGQMTHNAPRSMAPGAGQGSDIMQNPGVFPGSTPALGAPTPNTDPTQVPQSMLAGLTSGSPSPMGNGPYQQATGVGSPTYSRRQGQAAEGLSNALMGAMTPWQLAMAQNSGRITAPMFAVNPGLTQAYNAGIPTYNATIPSAGQAPLQPLDQGARSINALLSGLMSNPQFQQAMQSLQAPPMPSLSGQTPGGGSQGNMAGQFPQTPPMPSLSGQTPGGGSQGNMAGPTPDPGMPPDPWLPGYGNQPLPSKGLPPDQPPPSESQPYPGMPHPLPTKSQPPPPQSQAATVKQQIAYLQQLPQSVQVQQQTAQLMQRYNQLISQPVPPQVPPIPQDQLSQWSSGGLQQTPPPPYMTQGGGANQPGGGSRITNYLRGLGRR